jgi:hypothetical protein
VMVPIINTLEIAQVKLRCQRPPPELLLSFSKCLPSPRIRFGLVRRTDCRNGFISRKCAPPRAFVLVREFDVIRCLECQAFTASDLSLLGARA